MGAGHARLVRHKRRKLRLTDTLVLFFNIFDNQSDQVPPNAALVCEVDGIVTTIVVTISAPIEGTELNIPNGIRETLSYVVDKTLGDLPAIVDGGIVCDEGARVSLFIDDGGSCSVPDLCENNATGAMGCCSTIPCTSCGGSATSTCSC